MKTTIGTSPDGTKFRADPTKMYSYAGCIFETREPTEEEIKELRIPLAIVEIAIPEEVYKSKDVQDLIFGFRIIYSGLDIRTYNGFTHIGNIDLADIKKYVKKEVYEQMKSVGCIFPQEVHDLYSEAEEDETTA